MRSPTTMASSTTTPSDRRRPMSDSVLMLRPVLGKKARAPKIATGIPALTHKASRTLKNRERLIMTSSTFSVLSYHSSGFSVMNSINNYRHSFEFHHVMKQKLLAFPVCKSPNIYKNSQFEYFGNILYLEKSINKSSTSTHSSQDRFFCEITRRQNKDKMKTKW